MSTTQPRSLLSEQRRVEWMRMHPDDRAIALNAMGACLLNPALSAARRLNYEALLSKYTALHHGESQPRPSVVNLFKLLDAAAAIPKTPATTGQAPGVPNDDPSATAQVHSRSGLAAVQDDNHDGSGEVASRDGDDLDGLDSLDDASGDCPDRQPDDEAA